MSSPTHITLHRARDGRPERVDLADFIGATEVPTFALAGAPLLTGSYVWARWGRSFHARETVDQVYAIADEARGHLAAGGV